MNLKKPGELTNNLEINIFFNFKTRNVLNA
jgi:hypothetical protein